MAREVSTVVITGASRGIGLELCRLYAARQDRVVATCRNPAAANTLNALAEARSNVRVFALDVSSSASVAAAFAEIEAAVTQVDILINNAGQNPRRSFVDFDARRFLDLLDINVVGPLRVARAALVLLENSAKAGRAPRIGFVSSQLGALSVQADGFGSLDYNTSKAALNMIARKLSFELAASGVLTAAIHPGWVKTDMGGADAAIEAATSAAGIAAVLDGLNEDTSGSFLRFDGTKHPW